MKKIALYPLALLYGVVIWLRNKLFDWGVLTSLPIPGKSICIGNIAVGGTGKSPHVAYLIELLSERFAIQVLSRGYGRKTKGYLEISTHSSAGQVGDEPLMLFEKYHTKAHFAVCENRRFGVQQLKKQNPEAILLLDDAFQHRWVKAGLNIVLSTFDRPFWNDALLPAGRLRESAYALKRADALVITKCPAFDSFDANELVQISAKFDIPVFFSGYRYKPLQVLTRPVAALNKALLVSAIADPKQLEHGLPKTMHFEQLHFADHHAYTKQDIKAIHHFFDTFADENTVLVTTAKDWIKIASLLSKEEQQKYPWYLLSFELEWHDQAAFNQFISAYVDAN